MAKKVLVTGGTGFIGSALVHRLVKDGYSVRVLDNCSRGTANRLSDIIDKIDFIETDIRDTESVEQSVQGMDSVFHLAFVNGTEFFYSKPEVVLDVGVKGMVNIIDSCINNNVKELILASSSEVYQSPSIIPTPENIGLSIPDPINPRYSYAAGKIISEIMSINFGRKFFDRVLIFRPHNVYGPDMGWEHVIPQLVVRMKELAGSSSSKLDFPIQGTGDETRAFVYIDDFIDGLMLITEKGAHLGIYNIGTTEEITIKKLTNLIGAYFNKELNIIPGEAAAGGTKRRCPDITKIQKLGYKPKYSINDGLPVTAKWYIENFNNKPN